MSKDVKENKYMSSVKVGPKGQIVIPKEARKMFDIKPGDTLLFLADVQRGIAIHRFDFFDKIADEIFNAPLNEADEEATNKLKFVKKLKSVQENIEEE